MNKRQWKKYVKKQIYEILVNKKKRIYKPKLRRIKNEYK